MLHLILPTRSSLRAADLPPALAALLARGAADPAPADSLAQALCRATRIDPCPLAALSLLEEGGTPGDAYWLRADPVYLHLNIDQLVLTDPRDLALTADAAKALCASLNAHFRADGLELLAPAPDRWYLRLEREPALHTTALGRVIGQGIQPHLPSGPEAARWRSIMNEAQMLLFEHPVNQAREAEGLPPVNSLWFWGGGFLRALEPTRAVRLYGPPLPGAAPLPATLDELDPAREAVVVLEGLRGLSGTALAAQLLRYETAWFAPALAALKSRRLAGLTLYLTGDQPAQHYLRPRHAWRFWRRAQ